MESGSYRSPGLSDVLSGDAQHLLLSRCVSAARDRRRSLRQRRPVETVAAMVSAPRRYRPLTVAAQQCRRLGRLVGDGR